jgi:hypothetical protein
MGIGLPRGLNRDDAYIQGIADGEEFERRKAKVRNLEYGKWIAGRVQTGLCAIVGGWCVTHNTESNPGHSFDHGGVATLD